MVCKEYSYDSEGLSQRISPEGLSQRLVVPTAFFLAMFKKVNFSYVIWVSFIVGVLKWSYLG